MDINNRNSRGSSNRFSSKHELQKAYKTKAKQSAEKAKESFSLPFSASCHRIGATYGLGVGLYFKALTWMQWLFFILSVLAVPYFIVINTSVFTDVSHKDDHTFGVKVYEQPNLFSFTFAGILDSSTDNDTLQYMNTHIAGVWKGPMQKGTFLTWISLVDAGSVLLLLVGIVYISIMSHRFIESVDERTLEVSDYTVMVNGLPADVDPHELGEYFSRFGEVMDVVLVRDMRQVLTACATASQLEQRRHLLSDQMKLYNSVIYAKRAAKTEKKLEEVLLSLDGMRDGPVEFPVTQAFITFNNEYSKDACLGNMPTGWWSSLLHPRIERLRHKYRMYVREASAPEDYVHENMPLSSWNTLIRRLLTRFIVFLIIVVTAAIITRLGTLSANESRSIKWKVDGMSVDIGNAAAMLPVSITTSITNATVFSLQGQLYSLYSTAVTAVAGKLAAAGVTNISVTGANRDISASADWADYCTLALPSVCTPYFGNAVKAASVAMSYSAGITWGNQTEMLIKQRPFLANMTGCATGDAACVRDANTQLALPACLPCVCMGMSAKASAMKLSAEVLTQYKSQCEMYIDSWDARSWGIRIAVSIVIAAINYILKVFMEWLMAFERHWTRTTQEKTYAFVLFVAQLLNMALVLMLVNASPVADAGSIEGTTQVEESNWVKKYLVLNGQYNDFSPAWYRNVGISIILLTMISILNPLIAAITDHGIKAVQRCWVYRCRENAPQDEYNKAYSRPEFSLAQRVADAMLITSVCLLFGSGMPLLYPLGLAVFTLTTITERACLKKLYNVSARYSKQLAEMMLGILPWAALMHCLFGLWMHTYFKVLSTDETSSVLGSTSSFTRLGAPGSSSTESQSMGIAFTAQGLAERVTAANGVALLVCAILIIACMIVKVFLWRIVRPVVKSIFRRIARPCYRWCCANNRYADEGEDALQRDVTYETALLTSALHGAPTYRLPHHPAYAPIFNGRLHKAIWLRANGHLRYTHLVSDDATGRLFISRELLTEVTAQEVQAALGGGRLPAGLAAVAARLASPDKLKSKFGSGVNSPSQLTPRGSIIPTHPSLIGTGPAAVAIVSTSPAAFRMSPAHGHNAIRGVLMDAQTQRPVHNIGTLPLAGASNQSNNVLARAAGQSVDSGNAAIQQEGAQTWVEMSSTVFASQQAQAMAIASAGLRASACLGLGLPDGAHLSVRSSHQAQGSAAASPWGTPVKPEAGMFSATEATLNAPDQDHMLRSPNTAQYVTAHLPFDGGAAAGVSQHHHNGGGNMNMNVNMNMDRGTPNRITGMSQSASMRLMRNLETAVGAETSPRETVTQEQRRGQVDLEVRTSMLMAEIMGILATTSSAPGISAEPSAPPLPTISQSGTPTASRQLPGSQSWSPSEGRRASGSVSPNLPIAPIDVDNCIHK